ncbi:MAG: putative inner rane transporter YhbE [Pseudomonadota bacterium]|jgi:drug/metabolite transporter (DMT)-like permease|uniref:DMT family transporter n=1 Tax=Pseudaquabacterium rugosum TaxID=2984194 RepID=A0ABU9BAM8_9BURK
MSRSDLLALSAIVMWGGLAALGVSLSHVPPFLLTGLGLLVGSLIALPLSRFRPAAWKVPLPTLALGLYGLFGFHLLLFIALRTAPPVQANLVNYLWPLGMVVLAPLLLPGSTLRLRQVVAAVLGFAGAALAILGRSGDAAPAGAAAGALDAAWHPGYAFALASAFVWASYSLLTRRVPPFPTAAVGSFALASGLLSLACHAVFEPPAALSARDVALIVALGLGPLGGAFFLWDAALKQGQPQRIGLLAFLTPLLSTLVVVWTTGQSLSASVVLAAALIVGAAWWGSRG